MRASPAPYGFTAGSAEPSNAARSFFAIRSKSSRSLSSSTATTRSATASRASSTRSARALPGSGELEDVLPAVLFAPRPANPPALNQRLERSPGERRVRRRGAREVGLRDAAMSPDVAQELGLRAPDLEGRVRLRGGRPEAPSERAEALDEFVRFARGHARRSSRWLSARATSLDTIVDPSIVLVDGSTNARDRAKPAIFRRRRLPEPAAATSVAAGRQERHLPFAEGLQLPDLGRRRDRVQRGHVDAAHRPGLARPHPADPQ